MNSRERVSPCLPPDRIRDLVVELEQHGVDSSRIDVVAAPPESVAEVSEVDRASVARPLGRAAIGVAVGAAVGVVLGIILTMVTDLPAGTVLGTAIAGAVLGGLYGLYLRLPVTTDVVDVETGQNSMVRVDIHDLDSDDVRQIESMIGSA